MRKPRKKRKYIPLKVRLIVAIRQLADAKGCDVKSLKLDHRPALENRDWNRNHTDTVPPANSPEHLEYIPLVEHDRRTHGPGGEKRITTKGGDNHTARQAERLREKNAEFLRKMSKGLARHKAARKSKWPKRPMRGS